MDFSYEGSLEYLSSFSKQGAPVKDLSRFSALAGRLGDPQKGLRIIHIAGTNGKGSVAEYCASALTHCGYRTGRFTSPYVINIRERIAIDGEFISEKSFARLMGVTADAVNDCKNKDFSQFELLTAVCFLYFKECAVDFCCIEAGIGGTLDCTNIIDPPQAAVITSIALDHTKILGDTEEKIALSKCGIIKGGTAVAAAGISKSAMDVIIRRCEQTHTDLRVPKENARVIQSTLYGSEFCYEGDTYRISMCGAHQINNCLTAVETLRCIEGLAWDKVKDGLAKAKLPARMELIGERIILDGGHNPQAMAAAADVLKKDKRVKYAVIGMISTKDYEGALRLILPCFKFAVFTDGFADNAVPAETLAEIAGKLGVKCRTAHDAAAALAVCEGLASGNEPIFCGGSLYLACEIRAVLSPR